MSIITSRIWSFTHWLQPLHVFQRGTHSVICSCGFRNKCHTNRRLIFKCFYLCAGWVSQLESHFSGKTKVLWGIKCCVKSSENKNIEWSPRWEWMSEWGEKWPMSHPRSFSHFPLHFVPLFPFFLTAEKRMAVCPKVQHGVLLDSSHQRGM